MNKPVIIGAITTITIILFSFPNAFALEEFTSSEFGFSIKYPENWIVDDEVIDWGIEPGYNDGHFGIVYFYDEPNFIIDSIEVQLTRNDNIVRNNHGQEYLERVEIRLKESCEIMVMDIDGLECSNFVVTDSEITEHKGLSVYKLTQTWTEKYPDGTSMDLESILTDIVDGNDVWTIDGITIQGELSRFEPILDNVIESFSLKASKESGQKIPEWVKNTMEWYVDGLISEDEMISAIEFLIKEKIINI